MKSIYVDGEKLARNGRKTTTYYAVSFPSHYRKVLLLHLLVFDLCIELVDKRVNQNICRYMKPTNMFCKDVLQLSMLSSTFPPSVHSKGVQRVHF